MRKTIFAFMFAMMCSMTICSCGNSVKTTSDTDSTAVDSLADSLAVDTIAVDTTIVK